ncbi:MAG: hypothetical protein AAFV33_08630 [Chloroflexota bacterium]
MLFRKSILVTVLAGALALLLAACGAASEVAVPPTAVTDSQSAGAFMPTVTGYTVTGSSSLSDAISAAAGAGAEETGNPALQRTVAAVDSFVDCYQQAGAVAANIYTQADISAALSGDVSLGAGAVAIVNQDRVRENLITCIMGSGDRTENFGAQSTSICQSSGTFTSGGDTFTYFYISSSAAFCRDVEAHFNAIN